MTVKFISPLEKVFKDIEPDVFSFEDKAYYGTNLSFQVCFQADQTGNVTIKAQLPPNTEIRREKYVPSLVADYAPTDDYRIFRENSSTYYPDILEEFNGEMPVIKGGWYALWITVKGGIEPGEYCIKLDIRNEFADEYTGHAEQKFTIFDTLLEKCDIPISCWIYYECIATQYKVELFSDEYFSILKTYFDDSVKHGINTVFVPLVSAAQRKIEDVTPEVVQLVKIHRTGKDEYNFDWSLFDKFIDFAASCGFEYYEISHIASQQGAKHCPKIMGDEDGKEVVLFDCHCSCTDGRYVKFLSSLFNALTKYLKWKGIYERCFFHVSDEPSIPWRDNYNAIAGIMRKIIPDGKIIDAISNIEFADENVLTYPVVSTNHIKPFIEKNIPTWVYYCCDQSYDYLSNRFFNFPLLRTRIIGLQLYLNDAKGFLHWALNYWYDIKTLELLPVEYVSDGNGVFPSGDCFIVYPSKKGAPLNSLREEAFSDGIRDYRTLKTLEKKYSRDFVLNLLKDNGFAGYTQYPHSEKEFYEFWDKVRKLIIF